MSSSKASSNTADLAFPLYDSLLASTDDLLTPDEICLLINEASLEHGQVLWALVVHHYVLTAGAINILTVTDVQRVANKVQQIVPPSDTFSTKKPTIRLPYNGKMMTATKCPRFTFRLLPPNLQQVLSGYARLIKAQ